MSADRHLRCGECGARLPPGTPMDLCPFCVTEEPAESGGRSLGGCELFEELGRGGMGVVWRGRQRSLLRDVAVKTLPGGEFASADARGRFRTEALAAARLAHPGIVSVHEVGEDDGMPFIVMELVRGQTLSAAVASRPVSARLAARWLRDISLALEHAHQHGVLHRDLKPSNILIEDDGGDGQPKVTDFGLAKLTGHDPELTLSGSAMGSPAFMPPEQASGRGSDVASDVYGLGAVLYFALTGRPPFQGETVATVMGQVVSAEAVPPRRLNASVPQDVQNICLKCLEKNPVRRYASAKEVAEDLTRFLEGRPVHARPVGIPVQMLRLARRHPGLAAAAVLVVLLTAGLISTLAWRAETERRHAADLTQEKKATQIALARSRIDAARSMIRLQQADSGPQALEMMRAVLREELPEDVREHARDTALAAMALPQMRAVEIPAGNVRMDDWTMVAPDFPRQRFCNATFDGTLEIRSTETGALLTTFSTAPRKITALMAVSPGGRWLAIRHREELAVWDTAPESTERLVYHTRVWTADNPFGLMTAAFARDDSALIHAAGAEILTISLPGGKETGRWRVAGHTPENPVRVEALAFAADGRSVVLSITPQQGGTCSIEHRTWPKGDVRKSLSARLPVQALAAAAGGRLIAAGDTSGMITVWMESESGTARQMDFHGHTDAVRGLAWHAESRLLASTSEDGTLRMWDCTALARISSLPMEAGIPAFRPDGMSAGAGVGEGRLWLADYKKSALLTRAQPEAGFKPPQHVSFGERSDRLLALSAAGPVRIVAETGTTLPGPASPRTETAMEYPGSGDLLAGGADGLFRWPADGGAPVTLEGPVEGGWAGSTVSADGRTLAAWGRSPGLVLVRNNQPEAAPLRDLTSLVGGVFGLTLSPDASLAAVSHRYEPDIEVMDTATGDVSTILHVPATHYPAWSPDGMWVAASGLTCQLWKTDTWHAETLPGSQPSHPPAGGVAFSWPAENGRSRFCATVSGNSQILLFELPARRLVARLESPGRLPLFSLDFSRDHKWLAAGASGGEVQLWNLTQLTAALAGAE